MRILVQVFSFLILLSLTTNTHAQEHVSLLKKSVEEWNQWRKQNPEVIPDFRGVNLIKANLQEANLRVVQLQGADLRWADLKGANLRWAKLNSANLQKANLQGALNLSCNQINSVKSLDKDTEFPDYIMVKIIEKNKWTCKVTKSSLTSKRWEGR